MSLEDLVCDEDLREASACWHRDHVRIPYVLFVAGTRMTLVTSPMSLVLWTIIQGPMHGL